MKEVLIRTTGEFAAAVLVVALTLYTGFLAFEPVIGNTQTSVTDQFEITQTVTGEISFLTNANDVTMSPSLAGITGGTSNGQTYVRVFTNDPSGFNMTMLASSSPAMQGDTEGGTIPDYTPAAAGVPDFTFSVPANTAEFGYTVEASTTTDLDSSFLDNGTDTCDTGSNDTVDACWLNASSTAAETIVNRSSETADSGATTTLKFRITINSNPSPGIPADTYTATTTLTATINP